MSVYHLIQCETLFVI